MTALEKNPLNPNFLSPNNFRFFIKKAPNLNFFVQNVKIPGLFSSGTPEAPNPFVKQPHAGDHLQYDELEVTFKVDEDLRNYLEVHYWLRGLGFPEAFDEYHDLVDVPRTSLGEGKTAEIAVWLENNARHLTYEFSFRDAFPIALTGLEFGSTSGSVKHVTATAQFRYTMYDIKPLAPAVRD